MQIASTDENSKIGCAWTRGCQQLLIASGMLACAFRSGLVSRRAGPCALCGEGAFVRDFESAVSHITSLPPRLLRDTTTTTDTCDTSLSPCQPQTLLRPGRRQNSSAPPPGIHRHIHVRYHATTSSTPAELRRVINIAHRAATTVDSLHSRSLSAPAASAPYTHHPVSPLRA